MRLSSMSGIVDFFRRRGWWPLRLLQPFGESGVSSLESGVSSLESGVFSLESGVSSLESGVASWDVPDQPVAPATRYQTSLRVDAGDCGDSFTTALCAARTWSVTIR